jgi:hypothetical protein
MDELFSQLNSLIQNNQILSTVAGGSVIVWIVTNIKTIFSKLVDGLTALISFTIVNTYEDSRATSSGYLTDSQKFFNRFLSSTRVIWERTQHLDLSTPNSIHIWRNGEIDRRGDSNVQPLTYGFSLRIIFGKLVAVNRRIEKNQKITVTTSMRVFFASKNKFLKRIQKTIEDYLIEDIRECCNSDLIRVFNGETACGDKNRRDMDTIYTNNNEHYELLDSIKRFLDNKDIYKKLAYPYTYSALLYGEPGCGKTSTILAVASALHMDILYVNLGKITIERLLSHLNNGHNNIIVFEDIDALTTAVGENRTEEKNEKKDKDLVGEFRSLGSSLLGVSLSDLLNITDGLLASDGTICLFTTNHIERLDPAFLRSGRMNKLIEFSKLNRSTAARMLKGTLGWDVSPDTLKDNINPADLQAAILNVALGRDNGENLQKEFYICE